MWYVCGRHFEYEVAVDYFLSRLFNFKKGWREWTWRGGFLIRKEISYRDFQILKDVEGIAVKIPTVSGNLEIVNVYSSPTTNFYYNFF